MMCRPFYIRALLVGILLGVTLVCARAQRLPDEVLVEVSFGEATIDSALLLLIKSSGVNISYDPSILPSDERRSLAVEGIQLGLALDDVLYETGLKYKIIGNQLVIVKAPIVSDERYTISGYVQDADSDERLIYASVLSGDTRYHAITDEYGYYSMTMPPGDHYINCSYLGYPTKVMPINITNDTILDIPLSSDNTLNEVVVVDHLPQSSIRADQYDELPVELLNGMAPLAGEPDLYRMLHNRAGVTSGADGLGGINVRGGSVDQNLVLLDGVPIYNTGHALGLFSVFNPSVIKSAKLIKSGFPSKYGGRLSSVLDVRVKEGNKNKIQGDVSVSPLLVRGAIEGPLKKGLSSYMVSARRTIADPWLRPLSKYQLRQVEEDGFVNFYFYDINAKVNFILGDKDELYLSGYAGKDKFDNDVTSQVSDASTDLITENLDVTSWDWGNNVASLRWGHYFSPKWVSHLQLGYSDFSFRNFDFNRTKSSLGTPNERLIYDVAYNESKIQDLMATIDLDYHSSSVYHMNVGASFVRHRLAPGVNYLSTRDNLLSTDQRISLDQVRYLTSAQVHRGDELRVYLDNEISWGGLLLNGGLHYSRIATDGRTYGALQPRLALRLGLSQVTAFRIGYSQMDQYLHLLTSSGYGLPNDIWIPSTSNIKPQRSSEFSIGFDTKVKRMWTLKASGYYRRFSGIRSLAGGGFLSIKADDWDELIPVGEGRAYGYEIEIEKRAGKLKGGLNYTYAKSFRTFDDINNGIEFEAHNDRRHSLKLHTLYQLNENVELSASWQMSSGLPYTSPIGLNVVMVEGNPTYLPIYGDINNIRLNDYHRLDFAVNLYSKYSWGRQKLSLGAFNAYNQKNPFYIDVLIDQATQRFDKLEAVSLIPLVPFVSVSLSF